MELVDRLDTIRRDLRARYLDGLDEDGCAVSPRAAWPWLIGWSAGKDSTTLLQLVVEMLLELPPSFRRRPVHVLAGDTLVESPVYAGFFAAQLARVADAMDALCLPVEVHRMTPDEDQTFWVNLIGRGYPAPNRLFRWCTDRLKIRPSTAEMEAHVARAGGALLLLGVRRAESAARAVAAARYDTTAEQGLSPHNDVQGCFILRPILELTTEDIWTILLQRRPPWGGTHRDLVTLYRNAQGGECPFMVDQHDAPACGTSSARFGCWTCTVVERDRSMAGLIEAGFENLEPLADFRDWLRAYSAEPANRMPERRNGAPGLGGLTLAARAEVLRRLLEVQAEVGVQLISPGERARIEELWQAEPAANTLRAAKRMLKLFDDARREGRRRGKQEALEWLSASRSRT